VSRATPGPPDRDWSRLRAAEIAGVVLAAGRATRMGGKKVVRPIGGQPMVVRVVDAALASRLASVTVVVGHDADEVRAALAGRPVRIVENPSFADGLSTSLRAGLQALGHAQDGAMFLLADQPFVTAELIDRLVETFSLSGQAIVRPEAEGRPGNPVLFAASLFAELSRESGDRGGREVIERHRDQVRLVEVSDPRVCLDIDSPEDYERVRDE
jgi:molybdenum cofactor cytidylyltransferase